MNDIAHWGKLHLKIYVIFATFRPKVWIKSCQTKILLASLSKKLVTFKTSVHWMLQILRKISAVLVFLPNEFEIKGGIRGSASECISMSDWELSKSLSDFFYIHNDDQRSCSLKMCCRTYLKWRERVIIWHLQCTWLPDICLATLFCYICLSSVMVISSTKSYKQ